MMKKKPSLLCNAPIMKFGRKNSIKERAKKVPLHIKQAVDEQFFLEELIYQIKACDSKLLGYNLSDVLYMLKKRYKEISLIKIGK